jgi:hypothetical protein
VDDATPSQETGTAEAGTPAQCPAPTEEAGAQATVGAPICTPIEPASLIIATFDGASSTAFAPWGTAPLVGGTYEFPACTPFPPEPSNPLFEDFSMNNWHITGTVGTYSGFGIWWDVESGTVNGFPTYASGVIDASGYSGIQFDISGAPGPLGVITFSPESANQQSPSADPSKPTCGACDPDAGACSVVATYSIAGITSAPKTVQIRWSDLSTTLGQPLDPGKLVSLYWGFPWVSGATPYAIDVTIDNLQFIPASAGDGG